MSGPTNIEGASLLPTNDPSISSNVATQTGTSNQDYAANYGSGNSTARGLLNGANPSFDQNLDFGNQAQTQAIQGRYSQPYYRGEAQLSTNIVAAADADHLHNLQVATDAAGQEVELNRQKALMAWKIDQANKRARGQILGTTLGIVGGVVGGIYGGAGGATAGYAAGSGVGQAAGQGM